MNRFELRDTIWIWVRVRVRDSVGHDYGWI